MSTNSMCNYRCLLAVIMTMGYAYVINTETRVSDMKPRVVQLPGQCVFHWMYGHLDPTRPGKQQPTGAALLDSWSRTVRAHNGQTISLMMPPNIPHLGLAYLRYFERQHI